MRAKGAAQNGTVALLGRRPLTSNAKYAIVQHSFIRRSFSMSSSRHSMILRNVALWIFLIAGAALSAHGASPAVVRGPYLQMGTPTNIILRWRTDQAGGGRVVYGTSVAVMNQVANGPVSATNHTVAL